MTAMTKRKTNKEGLETVKRSLQENGYQIVSVKDLSNGEIEVVGKRGDGLNRSDVVLK